jgi:hypothetical protein
MEKLYSFFNYQSSLSSDKFLRYFQQHMISSDINIICMSPVEFDYE